MKIVHYPHPSLRHPAKPLTAIDKRIQMYAAEMLELMREAKGLGLAAPQVALPYQMFVVNRLADPLMEPLEEVIINPVILERKGTVEGEEGCLSFPQLYQKVRRAKTVKVQAYNLQGQEVVLTASELPSRVLQHETDHLHGTLYIDKFGPIAKLSSRGTLKEFERVFRKAQERGEIPPDAELEQALKDLEAQA
jgi:peptide deformylase